MSDVEGQLTRAVQQRISYVRGVEWRGLDPYDGLNSSWLPATAVPRHVRWLWLHLCKRTPAWARWALRIPPTSNPKGTALIALAASELCTAESPGFDRAELVAIMEEAASRLQASAQRVEGGGFAWGYPFPWQSRSFFVPRHRPNAVCTIFAARACLTLSRLLGRPELRALAQSAGHVLERDFVSKVGPRTMIRYVSGADVWVVNVWTLGASLMMQFAEEERGARRDELRQLASALCRAAVEAQRPDGSWPYGLAANQQFVDGYHTGFVLDTLRECMDHGQELGRFLEEPVARGYEYYWRHLVGSDGAAFAAVGKPYPVDVHAVAQALLTAAAFHDRDPTAHRRARAALEWWFERGLRRDGMCCFQVGRIVRNDSVFLRWGVAWMTLAMARYLRIFGST